MNTPVSPELDRLLLEKNIPMPVNPTIADVVMWLYEKYGIWISVKKDWDEGTLLGFESMIDDNDGFIDCGTFKTPIEAYEAAIIHTLNNNIK